MCDTNVTGLSFTCFVVILTYDLFSGLLRKDLFKGCWNVAEFKDNCLAFPVSHKVYRLLSSAVLLPEFTDINRSLRHD